jgi:hypothetical protein
MATTEKIIIEIDVQSNTLKDTEDKIKKVSGALVKLRGDEKANENQLRATEAELRLLNKTYREQDRVLQASIKANNAAEGSLEQLKAQYVVAQAAVNKLSAEQRENTQEGKDQMAEVARLNAELKRIESSYGQNARNVGNYTEAVKPLRQQLRELTMQLQQLEMQGRGNSEEFRNLSAEAGRIKDTMGDVNNTIKALASDTSLIDGVATGISGVAGAFSAAQGAAALFGDENEDLQKTLVRIQATMAIANGVQQVANTLQKDSAAMVALNTARTQAAAAAQLLYATVVGTTTGALKLFRIALATTGIGAIILLLGELIFNFKGVTNALADFNETIGFGRVDYAKWVDEQKRSLGIIENVSDSIETQKKQADLLFSAYEDLVKIEAEKRALAAGGARDIERQIKLATAQGASDLDLFNLQTKLNAQKLKDIEDQKRGLDTLMSQSKTNVELQAKYSLELIKLDQDRLDIEADNVAARIELTKREAKARQDALSALNTLENRIFSDNIEYKLNQLAEGYEKEQLIIDNAYSLGLIKEAKYNADKLALTNDYFAKVKDLISQQFNFEQTVRDTQLVAIDTFNQQVTDSIVKRDEDLKKQTDARIAYDTQASTEFLAKQEEEKDKLIAIYVQASDAINLAFTNSLTAAGIDLKKFQKQFIAIILDTIEKTLLLRYAEVILSSTAQLGPIAGPIAGAAAIGSIKALFAIAKSVVTQFEKGGIIPKAADGMLVGNRHAQGGIKIGTPSGMIEAEGGEVIINRKSVSMYKPLLSAINEAGGGVKFADGGQIYTPPVSQEFNILADMFKTMPQPVVSVVDIIDVTQKVGRVKATATL